MIVPLLFASPAFAGPVLDALEKKRYTEAMASASGDALLTSYVTWAVLSQPGGHQYFSFADSARFLRDHGDWPSNNRIRISVEAAQLRDNATGDMARWMCDSVKPISGRGMVACANLLSQTDARVRPLIERAWLQGDFDANEERDILMRYGHMLTRGDHAARSERLLYEGKTSGAQRMMVLLAPAERALADTRIALIGGQKTADAKLAALPATTRNSAGIVFDRIRFRHSKKLYDGALSLFATSPANPPYSNAWWPLRHYYAREAMAAKQYSKALAIVRKTGSMDVEHMAEALWLSGWLRYAYLNDPKSAYKDFESLYALVSTPVSKARGAYWAGRATETAGNRQEAQTWFSRAAQYPTVFYGQLAYAKLHPGKPLALPAPVSGSNSANSLIRMAEMLDRHDAKAHARLFWDQAAQNMDSMGSLAGLAERAAKSRGGNGVRVAKTALRRNMVLIRQGWPMVTVPRQSPIEPALTLAIARQESEFDPKAVSSANAQGLMQVLPGTAKHTIRAFSLPYGSAQLFDPDANLVIGSHYLSELIAKANGSYVVAIAGYNAGPGAALRWVNANGRPGQSIDATLRWMESIPYGETRNYVQRVIENLQVYRALLDADTPLRIEQDLTR